jgi:arginine decarboxylase
MKKLDLSSWPVLIVSGQVHEQNDEGFRLREIIDNLTKQQNCSVVISLTYHDAYEVFRSRADLGTVLVDWDIAEKFGMAVFMNGDELVKKIRKRNRTIPILLLTDRLGIKKIPVEILEKIDGYLWKTADTPNFLSGRIEIYVKEYAAGVLPVFFEELVTYVNEYKYAWHTPGHLGGEGFLRSPAGTAFHKFFGENVLRADLSISVPELGSLLDHSGVTGEAEKFSARVFGADQTFYVLNGTSTANQIIWHSQVSREDIALVDRNCHKSLNYAMVVAGAWPVYLIPRRNGLGIIGPVKLKEFCDSSIQQKIDDSPLIPEEAKHNRVMMSALTNSTYDGVCYNVLGIIKRLEQRVENLHFDEAWYAYARFHPIYNDHFGMCHQPHQLKTVTDCPPVFCSHSTHKLLTAFSQASMIHIKNGCKGGETVEIVPDEFNESYMMHSSTSPQYNMVASLDVATKMMHDNGEIIINDIIIEAIQLRQKMVLIQKEIKQKDETDWFFGMWQPETVRYKDKDIPFEEVPSADLARDQQAWTMTRQNNWHGFDLEEDEENYVMLDPIKLTFTCPGIDDRGHIDEAFGIPAAVVTNYLINQGIVCEKTDYYSWLMLNSLGTTRGKQGTLLAELLRFKELYDANTPLAEVFPELVAQYPDRYQYKDRQEKILLGLKDHCDHMHRVISEKEMLTKLKAAFSYIPPQEMSPADAFLQVVKKRVEYVRLENMPGRAAAVMIVPYPPGIPIMMGGERMEETVEGDPNPIYVYLTARQEFENEFPGYESDIHGIERGENPDGTKYFETYCLKK